MFLEFESGFVNTDYVESIKLLEKGTGLYPKNKYLFIMHKVDDLEITCEESKLKRMLQGGDNGKATRILNSEL